MLVSFLILVSNLIRVHVVRIEVLLNYFVLIPSIIVSY